MIAIILVLRYKDRQEINQNQKQLTFSNISPRDKINGLQNGVDMQLKKKKEVSFSIDEDLENMELCNSSSTTNSVFSDLEVSLVLSLK